MDNLKQLFLAIADKRTSLDISQISPELCGYALQAGLGPVLAYCASEDNPPASRSNQWQRIQGADKTAQIFTGNQLEFLHSIYLEAPELAAQMVLLKGAAMALAYYPKPHMRIMGDIDILVPAHIQQTLEDFCRTKGFVPKSDLPASYYENFHHSMPLYHPQKRIWVEVHIALFPSRAHAASDSVFSLPHIQQETMQFDIGGWQFLSFTPEMTLIYTMNHWCEEHNWLKSGSRLVDMLLIINNSHRSIAWNKILEWLETSPQSATAFYLLLDYLHSRKILSLPPEVLNRAKHLDRNLNNTNKKILQYFIDKHVLYGRNFGHTINKNNINIIWTVLLYLPKTPWARLLIYVPLQILFPINATNPYSVKFQLSRLRNLFFSK